MSAANYVRNKWVDMIVSTGLGLIAMLTLQYFAFSDADARAQNDVISNKADKSELAVVKLALKETATIKYVDTKIEDHEKAEKLRYEGIENMFEYIKEDLRIIKERNK